METKISVLVAEPSEEYRAAYARAIARETDMELVAQTDNGCAQRRSSTNFSPTWLCLISCWRALTVCRCWRGCRQRRSRRA